MAGIRQVVQVAVAILVYCIADISPVQVMYREGCISSNSTLVTKVTTLNVNASSHLTNNYPGTCLAYCQRQGISATYIALKDTDCRCGVTNYTTVNSTNACNNTCPGHDAHFCGGLTDFSLYIIESDPSVHSIFSCLAIICNTTGLPGGFVPVVTELNCTGDQHVPYCTRNMKPYGLPDAWCPRHYDVWNQSLSLCSNITTYRNGSYEDRYYHLKTTNTIKCSIGGGCSPNETKWIGAFAAWAPRKPPCSAPSPPLHGNVIFPYRDNSGDNETIRYSCTRPDYSLNDTATQLCMSDSNWSGNPPSCIPINTTGLSAGVIAGIAVGACIAASLTSAAIGILLKTFVITGVKIGAANSWHGVHAVYNTQTNLPTNNPADVSTTNSSDAFGPGNLNQVAQEVSNCCWSEKRSRRQVQKKHNKGNV